MGSLEVTKNLLTRFGAEIVITFSLPSFGDNFDKSNGISDSGLALEHEKALNRFLEQLPQGIFTGLLATAHFAQSRKVMVWVPYNPCIFFDLHALITILPNFALC